MPKATKWTGTDEQLAEIERHYREGMTVKELTRLYACRSSLISSALRGMGYDIRRGKEVLSPVTREAIIRRYLDGFEHGITFRAIGEEFGITPERVSGVLQRAGVKKGKWEEWTPERLAELRKMHNDGLSQSEIARRLGMAQTSIGFRLRQAGVPAQPTRSGENHGGWKGGRTLVAGGYIQVRPTLDDLAYCTPNSSGYVLEHRLVMGRHVGRPLLRTETVHHKNGDRQDNRIENLQLRQGQHGSGVVMKCNACGSHDISAAALV